MPRKHVVRHRCCCWLDLPQLNIYVYRGIVSFINDLFNIEKSHKPTKINYKKLLIVFIENYYYTNTLCHLHSLTHAVCDLFAEDIHQKCIYTYTHCTRTQISHRPTYIDGLHTESNKFQITSLAIFLPILTVIWRWLNVFKIKI